MTPEIYQKLDSDFNKIKFFQLSSLIGFMGVSWKWIKPQSPLGYIGTFSIGMVGGVSSLIITTIAKDKLYDFANDYWYLEAPKLVDRKAIPKECYEKSFAKLKTTEAFQNYLKKEKSNEKKAFDHLYILSKKGICRGSSIEILSQIGSNYSLSCKDLLERIKVEDALYKQLFQFMALANPDKEPRIIVGNFFFESFPACAPASVYKSYIENGMKKVKENEVIAGVVRIFLNDAKNGHELTFQCSDGYYRFYDAEKGFYSYPNIDSLFEHLRTFLIRNYSEGANGYNLNVQMIVYAVEKQQ